jgi:hypothetical protein
VAYPIHRTEENPAQVLKVDLLTFTLADSLTLNNSVSLTTSVVSGDFAYFG